MKCCSYCGAEYPDDAVVCVKDDTPLDNTAPKGPIDLSHLWKYLLILCSVAIVYDLWVFMGHWQHMDEKIPSWVLGIFRPVVFLRALALFGMWWGNRWAVIAFIGLTIIGACVTSALGLKLAIVKVLFCIALALVARTQWQKMTWTFSLTNDEPEDAKEPAE